MFCSPQEKLQNQFLCLSIKHFVKDKRCLGFRIVWTQHWKPLRPVQFCRIIRVYLATGSHSVPFKSILYDCFAELFLAPGAVPNLLWIATVRQRYQCPQRISLTRSVTSVWRNPKSIFKPLGDRPVRPKQILSPMTQLLTGLTRCQRAFHEYWVWLLVWSISQQLWGALAAIKLGLDR